MTQRKCPGSITIYLCLTLLLLLTLFSAAIRSVRIASGRAVMASALDQSLYSLFSAYDTDLYETYGLLYLEGGYGTGTLKMGSLLEEVEDAYDQIVQPAGTSLLSSGRNLLDISEGEGSITAYTLATDGNACSLREQLCEAAKVRIGTNAAETLLGKLTNQQQSVKQAEDQFGNVDMTSLFAAYDGMTGAGTSASGAASAEQSEAVTDAQAVTAAYRILSEDLQKGDLLAATAEASETEAGTEASAGAAVENPISGIRNLMKLGIFSLAVADSGKLSNSRLEETLFSSRTPEQGMGVAEAAEDSLTEKTLLLEYLAETFPCYTDERDSGMCYQLEYAIAGKDTDLDNLKSVLNRLSVIRLAANYLFLSTDASFREEVDGISLAICSVFLAPEMADTVAELIRVCWAYAESICDLRTLLSGGSLPLMKSQTSWKLSFRSLSKAGIDSAETASDSGSGSSGLSLSYRDYLRLLLFTKSETEIVSAWADLIEYHMRTDEGNEGFCMDHCIAAVKVQVESQLGSTLTCQAERYRSYD